LDSRTQRLAVLGSTGSIGRNTLQVVREMGDGVEVVALAAGGNVDELLAQALEFRPALLSLGDEASRQRFVARLREQPSLQGYRPEVLSGPAGNLAAVTAVDSDTVVSAAVGVAGLAATFEAVRRGKRVALANKEVLVAAGEVVMAEAARSGAELLPVDSEHNAVHQCLRAGRRDEVERLFLTASGGPFRKTPAAEFERITPAQALNHPTWRMGRRITIDSATLMNKGFEVIEACHLFAFSPGQVDVLVHPQSIVHSLIEFRDGSVIAQLSPPDMKLPIRYALTYPRRESCGQARRLDWNDVRQLEFEPPDLDKFRLLKLAYEVLHTGGGAGCVLNAADEIAVGAFLDARISFPAIPTLVEETLQRTATGSVETIEALLELDLRARRIAQEWIERAPVATRA
jgi:1-deoxy-D-xylulose-5-phosphate reductoisomerase